MNDEKQFLTNINAFSFAATFTKDCDIAYQEVFSQLSCKL